MTRDAPRLAAQTLPVVAIDDLLEVRMHRLFVDYYADVTAPQFGNDLRDKTFVVLVTARDELAGFTTAKLIDFNHRGERVSVLYSGDTIIDRRFWGEQTLAPVWLAEVGRIARRAADRRLFWFLIAKGHRTYRYLPTFARAYVPRSSGGDDESLIGLRDAVAREMFGEAYDAASGVIRFERPRGRLRSCWSAPSPRERTMPEVSYFLSANPGYAEGEELACLCELSRANMRPRAQRWFDMGFERG